jgi:ABC-type uncharacterized transport system involved in gliding motility auxiliary subunit
MGITKRYAKYVKFLIYLVVVILINVAGMTLFFRLDLTRSGIYSISEASRRVVSTLSEPLTINVFFTKNLPAPHNNTERYLHDLLEEYAIHGNKYFNYRFYNVSPEAEGITEGAKTNRELANSYGIHPVQIQAIEKDEVKFKKAYMGLVLIHGDMIERIPTITSTSGLEYQLTTAIQKLNNKISALLRLKDKIQVNLVLSSSLKQVAPLMGLDELPDYPDRLKQIIKELNRKNYGKLEYSYIDPAANPDILEKLKEHNLMSLKWPAVPQRNIPAGKGTIGLVMAHGDKVRTIPILKVLRIPIIGTQYNLAEIDQLEEMINENLETLIDINEALGYLADHGTLSISAPRPMMGQQNPDALTSFPALMSKNYSLKTVKLKDEGIPPSIKCLVIARPTESFADYELYQIDQALMRGTNLAIFLDAFREVMPQNQQSFRFQQGPTYIPLNTGLEKLLDHYGIRVKKSIVMDENCHKQRLPQRMGGGERAIYFAPIIKNKNISKNLDFMKNIKGLIAVKISPLELDAKRISENEITGHRLFASSAKSWEMSKRINLNPIFVSPPPAGQEKESFPLAYLLEGRFPSYFKGKPMPEKAVEKDDSDKPDKKDDKEKKKAESDQPAESPDKEKSDIEKTDIEKKIDLSKIEGAGGFVEKGAPGKIFLMASTEMLKDNILGQEGTSPNDMLILNVIDALNDREDTAVMRSKEQRFNPLTESTPFAKLFIKTFNIAGLPVLMILFGFFVWLRRVSRKKQIQMMFQK